MRPNQPLAEDEQYLPLLANDYQENLAEWEKDLANYRAREGRTWQFAIAYYLTGYQASGQEKARVHPYQYQGQQGIAVQDEDHLQRLMVADHLDQKPDPDDYMPDFGNTEELGWCLYETVSEGTPITPVFETKEGLVDHLATVGTWWGEPWRREAAETLVAQGYTIGSFLVIGGKILDSAEDADKIRDIGKDPTP